MSVKLCDKTIWTLEDLREQLLAAKRMHAKASKRYYAMPVTWHRDDKREAALKMLDRCAGNIMATEHAIILALLANGKKTTNKPKTRK